MFFPFIFLFKSISLNNPDIKTLFWWFYPAVNLASAIAALFIGIYVFISLEKKHKTLEDRIDAFYKYFGYEVKIENTNIQEEVITEKKEENKHKE
jgi:uncharacterized membrane protein YbhN (UPF0104 family)